MTQGRVGSKRIADRSSRRSQVELNMDNLPELLGKVTAFKSLDEADLGRVAAACITASFKRGDPVVKQGDVCRDFFLILAGEVGVRYKPPKGSEEKLASLKPGDFFGESALLKDEPRTATLIAEDAVRAIRLQREKFHSLELCGKLVHPGRNAVAAATKHVQAKGPSPKTPHERNLIAKALQENEKLQCVVQLTKPRVQKIIDLMWRESVSPGTALVRQGDADAHCFYIVHEGSFSVVVTETGRHPEVIAVLRVGDSFGELALLHSSTSPATVKAKSNSAVWVIDRGSIKDLIREKPPVRLQDYVAYMSTIDFFDPLELEEKETIGRAFADREFHQGDQVLTHGQVESCLFILYDGEVSISAGPGTSAFTYQAMGYNHFSAAIFGERALLADEASGTTIVVTSARARMLALDRSTFNYLLGPMEDLQKRAADDSAEGRESDREDLGSILRGDLVYVSLIGCGAFGVVELVQHKETEETFALKAVSKGYIQSSGLRQNIMNEKDILLLADSPFIVKLFETYSGGQTYCFLMEVCRGGDLYALYGSQQLTGSERHARYYTAGAVCALKHLHNLRIIYRDLKPENITLTTAGCPKLVDMGFAKVIAGKTYTTCGTPSYFAPELVMQVGHCYAVDWWCVGIFVYELMTGRPPFECPKVIDMYKAIRQGMDEVYFPEVCAGDCEKFVRELCTLDPKDRLPIRLGGIQNVQDHLWWAGFDWEDFETCKMAAPYVPRLENPTDIHNLRANKADKPVMIKYVDDRSGGWDEDFATANAGAGGIGMAVTVTHRNFRDKE